MTEEIKKNIKLVSRQWPPHSRTDLIRDKWWISASEKREEEDDLQKAAVGMAGAGIKPLFPNHVKYPKYEVPGKPDVPEENKFSFPLWIGEKKASQIMELLNRIHKFEDNSKSLRLIDSSVKDWIKEIDPKFYVSLHGMICPPTNLIVNYSEIERNIYLWEIECKIHSIEIIDRVASSSNQHDTPLRIFLSIENGTAPNDYILAKEINDRGYFFLKGRCDVAFGDVSDFEVFSLCYVEPNKMFQKVKEIVTDDNDLPF